MPVTPLRYGIVGTGLMGREHLRILALIPEVEAVAICDPHSASIKEALKITPGADTTTFPISSTEMTLTSW